MGRPIDPVSQGYANPSKTHENSIDVNYVCLIAIHTKFWKECVAALTMLYKKNGAVSCTQKLQHIPCVPGTPVNQPIRLIK